MKEKETEHLRQDHPDVPYLEDGSTIAVVGGGPSGSMFAFFVLETAARAGIDLTVDVYEPRDFSVSGPAGCNMCGGIVSESLVQVLAAEGIVLPPQVVQRGIDSYMLHTDVGSVEIETPVAEKRIAVVHRGAGPKGSKAAHESEWNSFDEYLQTLAVGRGARLIRHRVRSVRWIDGRPQIEHPEDGWRTYDLLTIATGVNSALAKITSAIDEAIKPPATTRAGIREFFLGREAIAPLFGSSMHMFLMNIPRLEFAAVIPKGEYACVCLLGHDIDQELLSSFLGSKVVKDVMPFTEKTIESDCKCMPKMAICGASRPYGDRVVFIGDAGTTRLYKDGLGAAYKTAKAAATTAVLHNVSAGAFRKYYHPVCRSLNVDNRYGRVVFWVASLIRRIRFAQRAVLRQVQDEQTRPGSRRNMSLVLWDMFTGSATYKDIFHRALRPALLVELLRSLVAVVFGRRRSSTRVAVET